MTSNGKRKFVPRDQVSPFSSVLVVYRSLFQHINQTSFTQFFIHNNCLGHFILLIFLFFNLNLKFALYVKLRNSLNTQQKKGGSLQTLHCDRYQAIIVRLARKARLIIKEDYFFSIIAEILGYNEDPETRQDATELEWGYIPSQGMKEKNFASVTSFARVISTTANFLNCRKIFFIFSCDY